MLASFLASLGYGLNNINVLAYTIASLMLANMLYLARC